MNYENPIKWQTIQSIDENAVILFPFWANFANSVGTQTAKVKVRQYQEVTIDIRLKENPAPMAPLPTEFRP